VHFCWYLALFEMLADIWLIIDLCVMNCRSVTVLWFALERAGSWWMPAVRHQPVSRVLTVVGANSLIVCFGSLETCFVSCWCCMVLYVWCVMSGLSVDEATCVVDARSSAASRAVRKVGDHSSSSDDILAVRVHLSHRVSHRCVADLSQAQPGSDLWLLLCSHSQCYKDNDTFGYLNAT